MNEWILVLGLVAACIVISVVMSGIALLTARAVKRQGSTPPPRVRNVDDYMEMLQNDNHPVWKDGGNWFTRCLVCGRRMEIKEPETYDPDVVENRMCGGSPRCCP